MEKDFVKEISEKVSQLPSDEQEEILRLVDRKIQIRDRIDTRPIWEVITEISAEVPEEEWAKLPSDGSVNHDHYLYGAPKKY